MDSTGSVFCQTSSPLLSQMLQTTTLFSLVPKQTFVLRQYKLTHLLLLETTLLLILQFYKGATVYILVLMVDYL